jgi:hypothetical protein
MLAVVRTLLHKLLCRERGTKTPRVELLHSSAIVALSKGSLGYESSVASVTRVLPVGSKNPAPCIQCPYGIQNSALSNSNATMRSEKHRQHALRVTSIGPILRRDSRILLVYCHVVARTGMLRKRLRFHLDGQILSQVLYHLAASLRQTPPS